MDGNKIAGLVIAAIVVVAIIVLVILYNIDKKNRRIVLENSQRIKELLALNGTMNFIRTQERVVKCKVCKSKKQLDNFSMKDFLISLIDESEDFYRKLLDSISANINEYNYYIRKAEEIETSASEEYCNSFGFKLPKFLKYEEKLFKENMLATPQLDVVVHCMATYTSPKGKNKYLKQWFYHYDELKKYFDIAIEQKRQRETRQHQIKMERSKMTGSLRYDILKRDDFRCQICGATAQDGVKLHVDHIIPVAKGGLTKSHNLRTLCDRCNMGKSDKIENS